MKDITEILKELTLEEKAGLCSGAGAWTTKTVERLDIPAIMMTDGPHGMRKMEETEDGVEVGLLGAVPATCFPTAVGLASTWNRELLTEVGRALAEEAISEGVSILLGPGTNIKRHPLCGRNFEYFSEDPYLAGEMAAAHITGIQSLGVGASLKHFAANNQETRRMTVDVRVDERTLREVYLPAFETVVRRSQPWTIMAAYNRLNGTYCAEHPWLLSTLLREEWGYKGVVVTDWGACNDRVDGIRAGLDLEMPGNGGVNDRKIVAAVRSGDLSEDALDTVVERNLLLVEKALATRDQHTGSPATGSGGYDQGAHHKLARRAAAESFVLLRNNNDILPLELDVRVALIGGFAETPRYQGAGSSHINPTRQDRVIDEVRAVAPRAAVSYAQGYQATKASIDSTLQDHAVAAAKDADVAVIFAGLPDAFESEGYDRDHMEMPESHLSLIEAVREVQPKVVVVLSNGAPVNMAWANHVDTVLECYLGGQAWGGAVADTLFGLSNPAGKLAETFPLRVEDTPAYLDFPGDTGQVRYNDGIFVGYRHYDSRRMDVAFPFGHGLSYSRFTCSDLSVSDDGNTVSCIVRNEGPHPGAQVVQLYVHDVDATVVRPEQELKGFEKLYLDVGESRAVTFNLDDRSYAFWDTTLGGWRVEAGEFEIRVGVSSRDIRLTARVRRADSPAFPRFYDRNTKLADTFDHSDIGPKMQELSDKFIRYFGDYEPGSPEERMFRTMVGEMPLRNIVTFSQEQLLDDEGLASLLATLNGKQ